MQRTFVCLIFEKRGGVTGVISRHLFQRVLEVILFAPYSELNLTGLKEGPPIKTDKGHEIAFQLTLVSKFLSQCSTIDVFHFPFIGKISCDLPSPFITQEDFPTAWAWLSQIDTHDPSDIKPWLETIVEESPTIKWFICLSFNYHTVRVEFIDNESPLN